MAGRLVSLVVGAALAGAPLAADLVRTPQVTELPGALKDVGIDQKLDAPLPLDATFRDERGAEVRLGQYFGKRPVLLAIVYYECPMLCTMVLNGTLRTVRVLNLGVGKDFDIVTVSFDPDETPALAARKKKEYVERYGRPGADQGWHFLTGDAANIRKLTEAAGFRFARDPNTRQWAHASAIMVATPEGKLSRYFYGVEYSVRDLRLGLVEAAGGKIGAKVDQVLLYCFHYDPATGKYSLAVLNILRGAGVATVLALLIFWFATYRINRRRHHHVELPTLS